MEQSKEPRARNWSSIWDSEDKLGDDWKVRSDDDSDEPLSVDQMEHLRSDILANVRFILKLRTGTYGNVYEVSAQLKIKDKPYFEPVWKRFKLACKIIRHTSDDSEDSDSDRDLMLDIEMSLNEMNALRYLRHENICNLVEIIGIPDSRTGFPYSVVCIFFELCDGDLRDLVNIWNDCRPEDFKGKWVLPEICSKHWFAQIANALDYIHDQGVIHDDIHAQNILMCYANTLQYTYEDDFLHTTFKLADFGEAIPTWSVELTAQQIQSKKKFDIHQLSLVLSHYGDPLTVHGVSQAMRDLIQRMSNNIITTREILLHEWLQSNTEPLIEPYILRDRRINFSILNQSSYTDWENVRQHPSLYPDYSPFGQFQRKNKEFDPVTQKWITLYDPIQGAANENQIPGQQLN